MTRKPTLFPTLPPLYFAQEEKDFSPLTELPSEILHHCLVKYSDWGGLAKLATVQRSWSRVMYDAAEENQESKWALVTALLNGTNGLEANATGALKLLLDLTNVPHTQPNAAREISTPLLNEQQNQHQPSGNAVDPFCPAMREVARLYLTGTGLSKAHPEAGLAWLQAAYSAGNDSQSAFELAELYEHGLHSVNQNVVAAAEWFEKAASAGHVEAMAELGLCYELGCGVEPNDELAMDWYRKAAEAGHVQAKYSIGEAFEEARGVPQSDAEACLWYYKAACLGDEDSLIALKRLREIARIVLPAGQATILLGD